MAESDDKQQNTTDKSSNALVKVEVRELIDIKPIGKLGTRIVDAVFGGFARLYNDATVVKNAERESRAAVIRAQSQIDVNAILANDPTTREGRSILRLQHEAVQHQTNIENVVRHAVEYANEQENAGSSKLTDNTPPIDQGWLLQFNDLCKSATKEEMQQLLGRVLAQEVAVPNTFSIRAIMTLTTISASEADAFQRLCQLYTSNIEVPRMEQAWMAGGENTYYNLKYEDIVACRGAGLIHQGDELRLLFSFDLNSVLMLRYCNEDLYVMSKTQQRVDIETFVLTSIGKELAQIIDVKFNSAFFDALKVYMSSKGLLVFNHQEYQAYRDKKL